MAYSMLKEDFCGPGSTYPQQVPLFHWIGKGYIAVQITYVEHPGKFWLVPIGWDTSVAIEKMLDALDVTYRGVNGDAYMIPDHLLKPGLVAAAIFEVDDNWYRVTIAKIVDDSFVMVDYVDYGGSSCVHKSKLRLLKRKFLSMPAQALPARLANVAPKNKHWTEEATRCLLSLCSNKKIMCCIGSISAMDEIMSVFLCDTSGDIDLHINDRLIEDGHAILICDAAANKEHSLAAVLSNTSIGYKTYDENTKSHESTKSPSIDSGISYTSCSVPLCNDSAANPVKHVKSVIMSSGKELHVINYQGQGYVLDVELKRLLNVVGHNLCTMLRVNEMRVDELIVDRQEAPKFFDELDQFECGIIEEDSVRLYGLKSTVEMAKKFGTRDLKDILAREAEKFNPLDPYWMDIDEGCNNIFRRQTSQDKTLDARKLKVTKNKLKTSFLETDVDTVEKTAKGKCESTDAESTLGDCHDNNKNSVKKFKKKKSKKSSACGMKSLQNPPVAYITSQKVRNKSPELLNDSAVCAVVRQTSQSSNNERISDSSDASVFEQLHDYLSQIQEKPLLQQNISSDKQLSSSPSTNALHELRPLHEPAFDHSRVPCAVYPGAMTPLSVSVGQYTPPAASQSQDQVLQQLIALQLSNSSPQFSNNSNVMDHYQQSVINQHESTQHQQLHPTLAQLLMQPGQLSGQLASSPEESTYGLPVLAGPSVAQQLLQPKNNPDRHLLNLLFSNESVQQMQKLCEQPFSTQPVASNTPQQQLTQLQQLVGQHLSNSRAALVQGNVSQNIPNFNAGQLQGLVNQYLLSNDNSTQVQQSTLVEKLLQAASNSAAASNKLPPCNNTLLGNLHQPHMLGPQIQYGGHSTGLPASQVDVIEDMLRAKLQQSVYFPPQITSLPVTRASKLDDFFTASLQQSVYHPYTPGLPNASASQIEDLLAGQLQQSACYPQANGFAANRAASNLDVFKAQLQKSIYHPQFISQPAPQANKLEDLLTGQVQQYSQLTGLRATPASQIENMLRTSARVPPMVILQPSQSLDVHSLQFNPGAGIYK